jgi:hypothetical protein
MIIKQNFRLLLANNLNNVIGFHKIAVSVKVV